MFLTHNFIFSSSAGKMVKWLVTGSFVLFIGAAACATQAEVPTRPRLDLDEWWGPAELQGKTNSSIRDYEIKFRPEMIQELRSRLKNHRKLFPPLEGTAFEYGFNTKQIEPWLKYWAEEYDFQKREKYFNKFPHYKTNIQGLDIHFIRVKPEVPANIRVVPLLILHGWPGSVREFYDAIPILTKPAEGYDFVFEVIAPSLPGFGFSDHAVRPGMGPVQMAVVFRNLMNRLGHTQYYVQAGDWGAVTANALATLFPENVLGYHTNFMFVLNSCRQLKSLAGAMAAVQGDIKGNPSATVIEESGYFHLQATKPDTIGLMLTESPVSLLAYIFLRFSSSTRAGNTALPDGGLYDSFTREQLIDNLMVYWSTDCITSAVRIYAEALISKNRALKIDEYPITVPTWVLYPKHEIFKQPIDSLKFPNVIGVTELDDGGHFLALQLPECFSANLFQAVKAFMDYDYIRTEL